MTIALPVAERIVRPGGQMSAVAIRVLSSAELVIGSDRLKFPDKGFQLLAFLALAPGNRATRRLLADLLWDSPGDATALANLRQLLRRMRVAPELDALVRSDNGTVWLEGSSDLVDAARFMRLVHAGTLDRTRTALALYRGDLLEQIGDASESFGEWLRDARASLREMFFSGASRALMDLTRYGNASADDLRAIETQLLEVERDREASYRALIEAYGRNGMQSEVMRLYTALESVLRRELHVGISNETRAVFRRASASAKLPGVALAGPRRETDMARVAFLPLTLLGGHASEPLVRALFDDVANNLARYRTMTVLAIHSSFSQPIAEETRKLALDADYQVTGFLLPQAEVLSLSMRDASDGEIIWAADYSIAPQQLAATFRMLSQQVAASLADALEHSRIVSATLEATPTAYRSFLRGKIELNIVELQSLRRARRAFESAAHEQDRYAAAHARTAQTLYLEWLLLGGTDPTMLVAAREQADAAIAYDRGGAEGYWMRGVVGLYQRDFDGAAEHFAIAESLSPHSADLLVQYADALSHLGQPAEGWQRFEHALQLNPMPPDHYWWAGASIAFVEERYDAVIALCSRMESDAPAMRLLAAAHALAGDVATARDYGRRVRDTYPGISRETIARLVPSRDRAAVSRYMEGLRLAGVE